MDITTEVFGVANKYLQKVRRSGPENVMAVCPFHTGANGLPEQHPSFAMSVTTGLWFCHSCHERGNLFTFLKKGGVPPLVIKRFYEPLLQALEGHLRRRACRVLHITVDKNPLPDSILGLFEYCPVNLLDEGFTEETLRLFDVGYDQKNGRITYPIRDLLGNLVGISGRGEDIRPKYKVYAKDEYDIWGITPRNTDKNRYLWNADRVYPDVYFNHTDAIIPVVEGFKGVMWLHQAGFKSTVALMGSWLSDEQQLLLERMGGKVYLFFDNDQAGHNAYLYAAKRLSRSLTVHIVQYDGHQPTDLTPDEIRHVISVAPEYYRWILGKGG